MISGRRDNAIYLDFAAATPVDDRVMKVMMPYYVDHFYNPSAIYREAREVKDALEEARAKTARILGARPAEIVFTAGATESINLAIRGVAQQYPKTKLLASSIEHEAVLSCVAEYPHELVSVDAKGILLLDDLKKKIDDNTVLVSIMLANNEIGTIQPIAEVAAIIEAERKRRKQNSNKLPLYLHSDGAQALNYMSLQLHSMGVDLLSLNGGKIYGPKQSGILYVKTGIVLKSQIVGGGQEWGLRSGTENVAQAIGFAEALAIAQGMRAEEVRRLRELRDYFFSELQKALPEAKINGHPIQRLANNCNFILQGSDSEWMVMALDQVGVLVSAGSACGASKDDPSHVLLATGLSRQDAESSLRLTMGRTTTKDDLDLALHKIISIYKSTK
jgi:cysteine desulfurase